MATKSRKSVASDGAQLRLCVHCAARGVLAEGELSYRHTPSGKNVLCKACWEQLHLEWLLRCVTVEEIPFDSFVDKCVKDAKAIYGRGR